MKVTNGDIWLARQALTKLPEDGWPVKTSYWLARLEKQLNDQFMVIEKVRIGIIRKYGTAGENGQTTVSQDSPDWAKFEEEYNELMNQEAADEITVNKIVLPDRKEEDMSRTVLRDLLPFVDIE